MSKWTNPDGTRMECRREGCDGEVRTQGLCRKCYNHLYYMANNGVGRKRYRKFEIGDEEGV